MVLLAWPLVAQAQAPHPTIYPTKPIRLIVPFPPGGSATIVARPIGQKLTEIATPYDAVKDFAPVATLVATEALMVVNPASPANNLQEFIALARSRPGQLNFASSGSGTTNHLKIE